VTSQARDHAGKLLKHSLPADLSSPERPFAPGLGDDKAGILEEDARSVAIGLLKSRQWPPISALSRANTVDLRDHNFDAQPAQGPQDVGRRGAVGDEAGDPGDGGQ
jgi:hypothetical protein